MSVQRFDLVNHQEEYESAEMIGFTDGDYVLHTDYAALEARCAGMERERDDVAGKAVEMIRAGVAERDALQAKLAAAEEALRHTCKHLCQWKDACETGCPVSAALADTTTGEVQP